MIKTAIIAPIQLLSTYSSPEIPGEGYHLLLSNLFGSPMYVQYYTDRKTDGDYIILDNSAHELGHGENLSEMLKKIDRVGPNEVVVPDRLFFGDDTVRNAETFIPNFRRHFGTGIKLMGVPQGRTPGEWEACARDLLALGVDTIGISKDYEVWGGGLVTRLHAIRVYAQTFGLKVPVHMLGWGRELQQISEFGDYQIGFGDEHTGAWIRGMDSAKPLVYAAAGIALSMSLSMPVPDYPSRMPNFFGLGNHEINPDLALQNIAVMRAWANG